MKTEHLYVLYGSQMGNSEGAAKDFCQQLSTKMTPSFFKNDLGGGGGAAAAEPIQVETTCLQLDDFLEMKHAAFTKCLVIFVSSYGVGQAPLGAYKFRALAEALLDKDKESNSRQTMLKGLRYAICGLGDSTYQTYLKNPTTIDQALTAAGAERIGEMGKADAHQIGNLAQDKTISRWLEDLWIPLGKVLATGGDDVDLKDMQAKTIPLLMELDPEYQPPKEFLPSSGTGLSTAYLIGAGVAVLAAVAFGAAKMMTETT